MYVICYKWYLLFGNNFDWIIHSMNVSVQNNTKFNLKSMLLIINCAIFEQMIVNVIKIFYRDIDENTYAKFQYSVYQKMYINYTELGMCFNFNDLYIIIGKYGNFTSKLIDAEVY